MTANKVSIYVLACLNYLFLRKTMQKFETITLIHMKIKKYFADINSF